MAKLKIILQIAVIWLPWGPRRWLLCAAFGYSLDRKAKIGLSVLDVRAVRLAEGARIGHLNYFRGLQVLEMGPHAQIGNLNWFTTIKDPRFFGVSRRPELLVGRHAAITNRHYFDCQDHISIGDFSIIGGISCMLLTHEIDYRQCRQTTKPITIGHHCFIGARANLLSGVQIGDCSIVGAGALVTAGNYPAGSLLAGVPARVARENLQGGYFTRDQGVVE